MKYVQFFFYNNLLDINLLSQISENIKIIPSYILVDYYNKENNLLIISKKESINKQILKGILVQFDITLSEILKKINELDKINKINKIQMYNLDTVDVNIYKDETTIAYIIY
jgi:hypothetical protein